MRKHITRESTTFPFAPRSTSLKALVGICFVCLFGNIVQANESVIKDCARCEALFTVQLIDLDNKKVFVIDRIIKGNVDARIMALTQAASKLYISHKSLVVVVFPGVREIRFSPVNVFGQFEYKINGKVASCSLDDLILELDESPRAAAARLKRNQEKESKKEKGDLSNRARRNHNSAPRQPSSGQ